MIKPIKTKDSKKNLSDKIKICYVLAVVVFCHILYFLLAGNNESIYQWIIYSFLFFYIIEIAGNFRKWRIFDRKKKVDDQIHKWLEAFGNVRATQQHILTSYDRISRKITNNRRFDIKEVDSLLELCRETIIYLKSDAFPDLPVIYFALLEIQRVEAYLEMIKKDIFNYKQLN